MAARTLAPRLHDIIAAIGRINAVLDGLSLESFEANWQARWLVERGLEIVSEASLHLGDDLKNRHLQIPWPKVAGIGNILRHDYERVSAPVMWKLARADLPALEHVCRVELEALR